MVGDRQRVQSQPNTFLDQFLWIAYPIQEAEVAVTVQLRVRHNGTGWTSDAQLVGMVRGPFVGVSRGIVAVWISSELSGMGRPDIRRSSSRQGIGGLFQPISGVRFSHIEPQSTTDHSR